MTTQANRLQERAMVDAIREILGLAPLYNTREVSLKERALTQGIEHHDILRKAKIYEAGKPKYTRSEESL